MANNPLDAGKSPEQLLAERSKRVEDALSLRQSDRIPINMPASYLLAEYGGITHQELQDNGTKAQELLERFSCDFEPDGVMGLYNNPRPSVASGDRMTRWPGVQLPATGSFQFDEHEFMKAEDYDAFLKDPVRLDRAHVPPASVRGARRSEVPAALRHVGLRTLPPRQPRHVHDTACAGVAAGARPSDPDRGRGWRKVRRVNRDA